MLFDWKMRIRFNPRFNLNMMSKETLSLAAQYDWRLARRVSASKQGVLSLVTGNVACTSLGGHCCSDVQQQTTSSQPRQHWAALGQQQQRPNSSRCCSEANCSIVKDAEGEAADASD